MLILALVFTAAFTVKSPAAEFSMAKYMSNFKNYPQDQNFLPILVFAQSIEDAPKYKAAGFNTYLHLWEGPKPGEIAAMKAAGMYLIIDMNEEARKHLDDKTIIGWRIPGEPENFEKRKDVTIGSKTWKLGERARIPSKDLCEMYETMKKLDPTRPIFANFSCGVANDQYPGRGGGWKNSMYPEYMKAGDIVSFDVYPVSDNGEKYLWYQAKGLDRLKEWTAGEKPRFNTFGPSFIGSKKKKPSPENIKTEIWISIIHGTKGLYYFAHNITPFAANALLRDPAMLAMVTKINKQVTALAPVINSPGDEVEKAVSSNESVPVDYLVKKYNGDTYVFAGAMKMGDSTTATFKLKDVSKAGRVEVLEENRTLDMDATGIFKDEFKTWETHIYKAGK